MPLFRSFILIDIIAKFCFVLLRLKNLPIGPQHWPQSRFSLYCGEKAAAASRKINWLIEVRKREKRKPSSALCANHHCIFYVRQGVSLLFRMHPTYLYFNISNLSPLKGIFSILTSRLNNCTPLKIAQIWGALRITINLPHNCTVLCQYWAVLFWVNSPQPNNNFFDMSDL